MDHIYQNIDGWFTFPKLYKSIVDSLPDNSHIVEIGCWKGKSASFMAVEIANSGKKIKFDCVDTWLGSNEHVDYTDVKRDNLYNLFLSNTETVKEYINPIRMCSIDASRLYKDESLDFVFIDASHLYEDVKADINAWYPKIKTGAVIAGHDYGATNFPDVKRAVDEFLSLHDKTMSRQEMCWITSK